jgi:hypothetical protein
METTKWVRYPEKCPFGHDDCLDCGPFDVCIETFVLVSVPDGKQLAVSTPNMLICEP